MSMKRKNPKKYRYYGAVTLEYYAYRYMKKNLGLGFGIGVGAPTIKIIIPAGWYPVNPVTYPKKKRTI